MPTLPPGLYDQLVDRALAAALGELSAERAEVSPLGTEEAHDLLTLAVAARLRSALRSVAGKGAEKLQGQVEVANRVLGLLSAMPASGTDAGDTIPAPPQRLAAILEAVEAPREALAPQRPAIPLRSSDLLINGRHDRSLGPQLRLEIESADRIDLLCSFVKWSGLRILEDVLRRHLERRPGSVRVLTTTYMGATEQRAVEALRDRWISRKLPHEAKSSRGGSGVLILNG